MSSEKDVSPKIWHNCFNERPEYFSVNRVGVYIISEMIVESISGNRIYSRIPFGFLGKDFSKVFCGTFGSSRVWLHHIPWKITAIDNVVLVSLWSVKSKFHVTLTNLCNLRAYVWCSWRRKTNWTLQKSSEEFTECQLAEILCQMVLCEESSVESGTKTIRLRSKRRRILEIDKLRLMVGCEVEF